MTYQTKALATDTNSRAELNDLYGDLIHETINLNRNFWNALRKVPNSSDRAGYRVRTAANSTADSYDELDTITTGNSTRQRHYFPIKQVKVGVEVSGLMMESAKGAGGVGDIWAEEIRAASEDLAVELDKQVLGSAAVTSTDISGLDYLIAATGAYSDVADRTATGYAWSIGVVNTTAEDLSTTRMRTMISTVLDAGAKEDSLLFVTNNTQVRKFKDLMQDVQRTVPTSSKVGFTGQPEFDGIPVLADPNVTSGEMFLLDMSTIELRVLKDVSIQPLPEAKDARAAFISIYAALICTNPSVNYKKTALTVT